MSKSNITNSDIYEAIGGFRAEIRTLIRESEKLGDRLSKVEKRQHWLAGAGSAGGGLFGFVMAYLVRH